MKPLRILHTADWHLGKTLKGVDRTPEIAGALEVLLEVVRKERVDLVLVAGDLFDRPQVGAEAEEVALGFFLQLKELGVPALVIAGNHDPKERLEALSPLFRLAGVRLRGRPLLREEGGVEALELGGVPLEAALLPFLSERVVVKKLREALEGGEAALQVRYAEGMRRILDNLKAPLMLAHLTVEGARPGGGEFAFYLGGGYVLPRDFLPLEAQYIALGHLHRQQQVSEAPVAWYPGSLVQLDFGEGEEAPRGALLVELAPGKPPRVHPIPAHWGRPLRTLRLTPEELDRRDEELRGFPGYLRLEVQGRLAPGVKERLFKAIPGLLEIREAQKTPEAPPPPKAPEDLLAAYRAYLEERGEGEKETLVEGLRALMEEVADEAPEA